MPTCFKDIIEPYDIALNIHIWILNTVAHTGLSRKVDYDIKLVFSKNLINQPLVSDTTFDGFVINPRGLVIIYLIKSVISSALDHSSRSDYQYQL